MRAICLLLLLAGFATADPAKEHRAEERKLKSAENKFWSAFPKRFRHALNASVEPFRGSGGGDAKDTYDYSALNELFDDYLAIQEAHAKADIALGDAKQDKGFEWLFRELLAICKRIDRLERDLPGLKPIDTYVYDQRPGLELVGLEIRLQGLTKAVAGWSGLHGKGWERAKKGDGRKSALRRVAVIDALGLQADKNARVFLGQFASATESSLRIAAADALLRAGPDGRAAALPLLKDRNGIVRRALLQGITARGDDPGWIGPVLEVFSGSVGQEHAEALTCLGALTNQTFGDDAALWKEWYEDYRKEIDGGGFDKTKIEIQEVKPVPRKGEFSFYGIPSTSRGLVFVIEDSSIMYSPASYAKRKEQHDYQWWGTRRKWESDFPSHKAVLQQQLDTALDGFDTNARFGLVLLHRTHEAEASERLFSLSPRDVKAARKMIEKMPSQRWCSPLAGLVAAGELGGLGTGPVPDIEKPAIDTVFLLGTGELRGGRYFGQRVLVAAFKRFNRFRRLVVHTIRIDDSREPSEIVMKGLAEASGGRYVWIKEPLKQ